ncbi:MAG: hypothetical protein AAFX09_01160 [Pseudomonadota bacterium]
MLQQRYMSEAARTLTARPWDLASWALIVFSTLPILALRYDQWDGALIADFLLTRDLTGVTNWMLEGQGPLLLAVFWLISIIDAPLRLIDGSVFAALSTALGMVGVWRASRFLWNAPIAGFAATALMVATPLHSLFASSMHAAIFGFIGIGLIGFVEFQKPSPRRWLGLAMMVFSVEIAPMIILLPALIALVELRRVIAGQAIRWGRAGAAALLPAAYLVGYGVFFTGTGIYSAYNQFDIQDLLAAPERLFGSSFFMDFTVPPAIIGLVMISVMVRRGASRRAVLWRATQFLLLTALALAVAAPYAMVNKTPPSYDLFQLADGFLVFNNSNYRHALMPVLVMAIALSGLVAMVSRRAFAGMPRISLLAPALFIALQGVAASHGWQDNFQRDEEIHDLIASMRHLDLDQTDLCAIDISTYPAYAGDRARSYELTYYAGLAGTGRATLLAPSTISERLLGFTIDISCRSPDHQAKYGVPDLNCARLQEAERSVAELQPCPFKSTGLDDAGEGTAPVRPR